MLIFKKKGDLAGAFSRFSVHLMNAVYHNLHALTLRRLKESHHKTVRSSPILEKRPGSFYRRRRISKSKSGVSNRVVIVSSRTDARYYTREFVARLAATGRGWSTCLRPSLTFGLLRHFDLNHEKIGPEILCTIIQMSGLRALLSDDSSK